MSARRTSHNTIANDAASVPSFDKLTPIPSKQRIRIPLDGRGQWSLKKTFSVQSSAHDARVQQLGASCSTLLAVL